MRDYRIVIASHFTISIMATAFVFSRLNVLRTDTIASRPSATTLTVRGKPKPAQVVSDADWVTVIAINPLGESIADSDTFVMTVDISSELERHKIEVNTISRFVQCVAVRHRDYMQARQLILDLANAKHYRIAYSADDAYKPAAYLRNVAKVDCSHLIIVKPLGSS